MPGGELYVKAGDSISAAITQATTFGGGTVRLGPGTHTIAAALNLASGVNLKGMGRLATILSRGANNIVMIQDNGATVTDVTISDMTIAGAAIQNNMVRFTAAGTTRIAIDNCHFTGTGSGGAMACISVAAAVTGMGSVSVRNCTSIANLDYWWYSTAGQGFSIDGNAIGNLTAGQAPAVIAIYLTLANDTRAVVSNNLIAFGTGAIGIQCDASVGGGVGVITISGNVIQGATTAINMAGAAVNALERCTIVGNTIRAATTRAIDLNYCHNSEIVGNQVQSGANGIRTQNTAGQSVAYANAANNGYTFDANTVNAGNV